MRTSSSPAASKRAMWSLWRTRSRRPRRPRRNYRSESGSESAMKIKKVIYRLVGVAVLAGAGWGGYKYYRSLPDTKEGIPTTKVQKSDVIIRAYSRGELKP